MSRPLAPLLIALALLSAGCLGTTDEEPLDASATGNSVAVAVPPQADVDANRTGGMAPLNVSFTLEGTPGADNASALAWSFQPGDGSEPTQGTGLPATVNHTYEEAGSHTAVFTVTEGNQTAEDTLTIEVEAPASEPETQERDEAPNATGEEDPEPAPSAPEPVVINGTALIGNPAHSALCLGAGIDGDMHAIEPAGQGWTYAIEPAAGFTIYWWGEEAFIEPGSETGTVPADATRAEVCATPGTVMGNYTLTLWQPGHPDAPAPE